MSVSKLTYSGAGGGGEAYVPGVDVRWATVRESSEVARLLHDFNTEFDTPSPGVEALTARLEHLLARKSTAALLAGEPAVAVGLVTYRPNVWYPGPVALLDELYVEPQLRDRGIGTALITRLVADSIAAGVSAIEVNVDEGDVDARRFYERHGFISGDVRPDELALYYAMELPPPR